MGYCNCRSVEGVLQSLCKNGEAGGNSIEEMEG